MIAILDVDTSTLGRQAEIIAAGLLIIDPESLKIMDTLTWFVRPQIIDLDRWPDAEEIHGYDVVQIIQEGCHRSHFVAQFHAVLAKYSITEILAWNADWTQTMMDRVGVRSGDFGPCLMHSAARHFHLPVGERRLSQVCRLAGIKRPIDVSHTVGDLACVYALYCIMNSKKS